MTQQLVPVVPVQGQPVNSALQPYIDRFGGKVNVLLPIEDVQTWSPFHAINVSVAQFKATAAHCIDGKFMHTKAMLDTLATYARAEVVSSIPVKEEDENVFTHTVTMKIVLGNGTPSQKTFTKTVDLRDNGSRANRKRAEVMTKEPQRKGEPDEDFQKRIEEKVQKEMRQARVFGRELAESGAMNRCLRALLGLKLSWTKEEFEYPFLVVTAKVDTAKLMTTIGEKVFAEFLMSQAFGNMTGAPGVDVSHFLETVESITPDDLIEAQVQPVEEESDSSEGSQIVIPDEEYAEMIGAEYGEDPILGQADIVVAGQPVETSAIGEQVPKLLDGKQQGALTDFLTQKGYPGHKAVNGLLNSIWEGCHIGNVNTLQAKIACQYARDVYAEEKANAQRGDDKKNTATMQAWKDARKVLCRDAYRMVKDLDEYLEFMQGKPL